MDFEEVTLEDITVDEDNSSFRNALRGELLSSYDPPMNWQLRAISGVTGFDFWNLTDGLIVRVNFDNHPATVSLYEIKDIDMDTRLYIFDEFEPLYRKEIESKDDPTEQEELEQLTEAIRTADDLMKTTGHTNSEFKNYHRRILKGNDSFIDRLRFKLFGLV